MRPPLKVPTVELETTRRRASWFAPKVSAPVDWPASSKVPDIRFTAGARPCPERRSTPLPALVSVCPKPKAEEISKVRALSWKTTSSPVAERSRPPLIPALPAVTRSVTSRPPLLRTSAA